MNVTLFGSRGTSAADSSSSGSFRMSSPRFFHVFAKIQMLWSCIIPMEQVPCQKSLVTTSPGAPRNDTNVSSCCTQRDSVGAQALPGQIACLSSQDKRTKSEQRRRRHHDSPPPKQREIVLLLVASFANLAVQTDFLSSTSVRRQLHHRRLLLLEFLLQMTILPPVSYDSNARISETCLILCLATTRSLQ